MSTSTWTGAVRTDWADPDNWSPAGVPGVGSDVTIATGDAVASASIGTVNSITDSSDLSFESAGTNAVTTFLDDAGHLWVDHNGGEGGTILNIGATLTNSNHLVIGNTALSASDEVTATSLDNTGSIYLIGSSANQALLDVTAGVAEFGAAGTLSGYVRLAGDSAIEFASGQITSLAASAHLGLVGTDAFVEDSTAPGSNSALTGLASIGDGASFALHDGAAVSTGALVNGGHIHLDFDGGDGGSSLTLAGALTNSGSLSIGNATLSGSDKVTAASLDNTGSISLTGSGANQALLDVTGSAGFGAAGVLSGYVRLAGDSAIEFKSGQITSLAAFAQLHLNGNDAFLEDSTALGSNSALTGLASIGAGARFGLNDQALLSTAGALANDGNVYLDANSGDGGSSLTLAGALTNNGNLTIGNTSLSTPSKVATSALTNTGSIHLRGSSADQALLDVAGSAGFGAAGVLSGHVRLKGDSAIEFASGQITSLAINAQLHLNGNSAFIEDSTALGSNSALTGLASIGAGAKFTLENKAAVSTTGALVNDGNVYLDTNDGDGGSSLTVAGALTNSGVLVIGITALLSSSSKVATTALTNTGSISLVGSGANQALLDVTAGSAEFGAAGVLSGYVQLDGDSAIEFKSGQISTIGAGSRLTLLGNSAFIEDSTAPGSNSALTGLADIAGGLSLQDGASVSTTGSLTSTGAIFLYQGGLLDVTAGVAGFGAAGTLTGSVDLIFGSDAIEFKSGQINTIAASSQLTLFGNDAFIEDSTALGSNSALTGLADIAGSLYLDDGAAVSTTGALVNDGSLNIDNGLPNGGSSLTVAGTLTNTGKLDIGRHNDLSSSDSVTANSFFNSGTVDLNGNGTNFAVLNVSGATTNNGSISIASDTEELAGAVGGAGSFSLSNAHLLFDSSVSSGQTIDETGADGLTLKQAQSFAATISGFGTGDTIDATNFLETATTYDFVENIAGTGGTLSLHDGSLTANILMTGVYSNSSFTLAHDSGTGTLVKFV